jgi:hypothetical protein
MPSLFGAIQWIQDEMLEISGIKAAPDYPSPSAILPVVITHLGEGVMTFGNPLGQSKELVSIVCELHISQSGAGDAGAFKTLETLHPLIKAKFAADHTLGSNVSTYESISYVTGRGNLDGVDVISRIYTLNNVKYQS